MGLFKKNYTKMLAAMGEQERAKLTNDWEYVLTGYCVVNRGRLEKPIILRQLLVDMGQYYAMPPLIDERMARDAAIKFGLPIFNEHKGVGLTVGEYYSLVAKQLQVLAGYTEKELLFVDEVEKSIDSLGIAPSGETQNLPVTHTQKPNIKASYSERISTSILIGDALNILGYFANKIGNSKTQSLKKFYVDAVTYLAKEGNLTNSEIDQIIKGAEAGQKQVAKAAK